LLWSVPPAALGVVGGLFAGDYQLRYEWDDAFLGDTTDGELLLRMAVGLLGPPLACMVARLMKRGSWPGEPDSQPEPRLVVRLFVAAAFALIPAFVLAQGLGKDAASVGMAPWSLVSGEARVGITIWLVAFGWFAYRLRRHDDLLAVTFAPIVSVASALATYSVFCAIHGLSCGPHGRFSY